MEGTKQQWNHLTQQDTLQHYKQLTQNENNYISSVHSLQSGRLNSDTLDCKGKVLGLNPGKKLHVIK